VIEREVKLEAALSFRLPALDGIAEGVDIEPRAPRRVSATYFDTDDLRLTRWGVSLRHRSSDGWTVKLPHASDGKLLVREELVFDGDPRRPPVEAVDLVRAFVRTAALRPQVRLRTIRRQTSLRNGVGESVAEVVDDEVAVLDGRKIAMRFHEVEVEISDDSQTALLEALIGRLQQHGAGPPDPTPKVVRALGARASRRPEVLVDGLAADATIEDVVRRAIAASVERLIRHDPIVRLDTDPEGVHQTRVATRRLRSDLRTFRSVLDPDWAQSLRSELGWLAESLGAVRDADVLLARIAGRVDGLPEEDKGGAERVLAELRTARAAAYDELLEALRSERYLALLDRLIDAANAPVFATDAGSSGEVLLRRLVRQPLRKLARQVEALGDQPTDEELHAVRIRAKRARYAAEAAAPVLGKHTRAEAAAAAKLQDVLGEQRDAVVAERWLRAQVRTTRSVATAFAAGELAGLERAAATRARKRWRKAWKKLSRTQSRASAST
jgi:CHAD domain-containing protein